MEMKEVEDTDTEVCPYTLQKKKVITQEAFLKHGRQSRSNLALDLTYLNNEKKVSLSRSPTVTEQKRSSSRKRTLSQNDMENVMRRQRSAFGQTVNRRRRSMSSSTSMLKPRSPGVSFYNRKHLTIQNKIKGLSVSTKLYMCRIFCNIRNRVFKRLFATLIKWKYSVGLSFHPDRKFETSTYTISPKSKSKKNGRRSNTTNRVGNKKRSSYNNKAKQIKVKKQRPLMINRPYIEKKLKLSSQALYYEKNRQYIVKVWYKWQAVRQAKKAAKVLLQVAINTYNRRCKMRCTKRWKKYTRVRVVARNLLSTNVKNRNEHIATKYFTAWSRKSIKFKFERQTLNRHEGIYRKFVNVMLKKTTFKCFNDWRTYSSGKIKARTVMLKTLKRMDNGILAMGMDTWIHNTKEITKERIFMDEINYLKNQMIEQEKEKKKILCNRVFQRIVNRQLICAWEEWREHVKIQNLLQRISARFRASGKARTLNTWIAYVKYRRYARDLANRVFRRLDNRGLSAAWTQWVAFVNYDKHTASLKQLAKENEANIDAWREETTSKHLSLKKLMAHRVSVVKVFTRWRILTVKEKDLRLVQAMNVLRNALRSSHEELRIMKQQYHVHMQLEVEGMLRYIDHTGKKQSKKRLEYQNAESVLHTHEINQRNLLNDNQKSRVISNSSVNRRPIISAQKKMDLLQNNNEKVSIHQKLVKANKGKPVPWLSSTSPNRSANATGRVQEMLAKSFVRNPLEGESTKAVEKRIRKKKKSVAEIMRGNSKNSKKINRDETDTTTKGKKKSKKEFLAEEILNTPLSKKSTRKRSTSKTRMKKRMLQQKGKSNTKSKVRKSTPHVDLSSKKIRQKPLISNSKKFDKKRHFLNSLQSLRLKAEDQYFEKQSPFSNRKHSSSTAEFSPLPLTPDASIPDDESSSSSSSMKNIIYQSIKDYEEDINDIHNNSAYEDSRIKDAIVQLVNLLEESRSSSDVKYNLQSKEKAFTKLEKKELRKKKRVDQEVSKRNEALKTKKVFDNMLVDYAKRVHNYQDPTLQDARRPMPLLNMNEKL